MGDLHNLLEVLNEEINEPQELKDVGHGISLKPFVDASGITDKIQTAIKTGDTEPLDILSDAERKKAAKAFLNTSSSKLNTVLKNAYDADAGNFKIPGSMKDMVINVAEDYFAVSVDLLYKDDEGKGNGELWLYAKKSDPALKIYATEFYPEE